MAIGVDAVTGLRISGVEELRQRINRLFSTRKTTLVLKRRYGCNLPDLLDKKINQEWRMDLFAEAAQALADPENELNDEVKLHRTYLVASGVGVIAGKIELAMDLQLKISGEVIRMEGVTIK